MILFLIYITFIANIQIQCMFYFFLTGNSDSAVLSLYADFIVPAYEPYDINFSGIQLTLITYIILLSG